MYIKKVEAKIEGKKRQNFPYIVTDNCPECGQALELDLTRYDYICEPIFDQPTEIWAYCTECGIESNRITVIPRLTLEIV